jgi:hypothetical protein
MASSAPPTVATEEVQSDTGKLKTFLGILRRFIGVSDLASVRFSLPSQLLEPTPNLEYWTYIDAPNAFVAMGTSEDPLDRMLEVVRFWLSKDLKYAKGKPCKPYNSCLGEFFRVRGLFPIIPTSRLFFPRGRADQGINIISATGRRKTMRPGSRPPT